MVYRSIPAWSIRSKTLYNALKNTQACCNSHLLHHLAPRILLHPQQLVNANAAPVPYYDTSSGMGNGNSVLLVWKGRNPTGTGSMAGVGTGVGVPFIYVQAQAQVLQRVQPGFGMVEALWGITPIPEAFS